MILFRQADVFGGVCEKNCTYLSFCDVSHSFPDVCMPKVILGVTGSGEMAAGMAQ